MRQLAHKGLTKEALEVVYDLQTVSKLQLEDRLNGLRSEIATVICAIDDKKITNMVDMKTGLVNLFEHMNLLLKTEDERKKVFTSNRKYISHLENFVTKTDIENQLYIDTLKKNDIEIPEIEFE